MNDIEKSLQHLKDSKQKAEEYNRAFKEAVRIKRIILSEQKEPTIEEIIDQIYQEIQQNIKTISVEGSLYISLCDIKNIIRIIQPKEPLTEEQLEAMRWLKEREKRCIGCDYEKEETDTVPCCMCSRLTEDEYRPKKPLTIGDRIRESNESLAEFINHIKHNCNSEYCTDCRLKESCSDVMDYLNQPSTGIS